ncbi:glycosyltransferase [Pararhodobacter oceanensis]|uniref:Glycosyl transferase family 1 domain-containing protein n=1 Tax=Pararhodobacter oceanensis TaxID=2172121 RepID=A0A2T8HS30_9RHOB|nr:glycosyltransferase [Pararhodobacter oceanensis]PVH28246.1 hypothetical protein DDE20_14200 [Pararhodobacter oceanensis]
MNKIIVGGIPEPIGGVTTYLRRLLHRDSSQIEWLLDFYPGNKESVREDCQNKVIKLGSKAALIIWLWTNRSAQTGREVSFNFSTPRALFLTLLLPKIESTRWILMLHHGNLEAGGRMRGRAIRWAVSRFDEVRSLSEAQTAFYRAMQVKPGRIVAGSSYCEPADHVDDADALAEVMRIKDRYSKVFVMSGFPKSLYNLEMGIDAMRALYRDDCALCVFIYGPGELRTRLMELSTVYSWLRVYDGSSESFFNTVLRHSDVYMRLTSVESFGIAVWDANYWGLKLIATDAADRPTNSIIIGVENLNEKALKDSILQMVSE